MEATKNSSPSELLEEIWDHITHHNKSVCPHKEKDWPHYKAIMDDITYADYNQVLQCPLDIVNKSRYKSNLNGKLKKVFCAHGVVVCAKIEMFPGSEANDAQCYTGLLSPGNSIDNCIMRLSNAMKPPASESNIFGRYFLKATGGKLKHATLFPMVAIKALRGGGARSGNLLFAGPKTVGFLQYTIPVDNSVDNANFIFIFLHRDKNHMISSSNVYVHK